MTTPKKKILLVDDSRTTLMMEKMILRTEDFDIVTAADGAEGVRMAIAEKPDLIVLDIVMPNMDGFETCTALRAQESTAATPIIMVTTRGEEANVQRGYEAGCNDYVTKPINGLELLTKVRDLLGQA